MPSAERSTRREFLQGKSAAEALEAALAANLPCEELASPTPGHYLVKLARRAMACQFEFYLNAGQYPEGTEAALAALDLVDRLEAQLSIYRDTSEIAQLNRRAGDEPVIVEPRLFALLQLAVQLWHETAGAYDVTAGALSRAWGFTRRAGSIPAAEQLAAALESVGSGYLHLDPETHCVRFQRSGLEINLGSIGKGYALDRCRELLSECGIGDFLLHGGHSSVLARGARGGDSPHEGWAIGVRDPLHPTRRLGQLRVRNRAVATSGSGTQFFEYQGRRYGHILDPRSGWPAQGVASVSVLAPSAAEADALSTAFYVLGPEAADEYCQAHPGISAVMLCPARRRLDRPPPAGARSGRLDRSRWTRPGHLKKRPQSPGPRSRKVPAGKGF